MTINQLIMFNKENSFTLGYFISVTMSLVSKKKKLTIFIFWQSNRAKTLLEEILPGRL